MRTPGLLSRRSGLALVGAILPMGIAMAATPAPISPKQVPDLVVEGPVETHPPNLPMVGRFTLTIRNAGRGDSPATNLQLECHDPATGRCLHSLDFTHGLFWTYHVTFKRGVPPLHPGETSKVDWDAYKTTQDEEYRLQFIVTVDPEKTVAELYEQNNRKEFTRSGLMSVDPSANRGLQSPGSAPKMNPGSVPHGLGGPTPTPAIAKLPAGAQSLVPRLTLSVDPPFGTAPTVYLIAKNTGSIKTPAASAQLSCQQTGTGDCGGSCSVIPSHMAVSELPPGQWKNLGTFSVGIAAAGCHSQIKITVPGVASNTLVLSK